ncbi:hypothetical protein M0R45_014457 [Rubus argutus]|uniref:NAC domain-containing protein n=1 Tax=Rubus argutus TaxID=59490 RepID=A0AAW1XPZ8_RUBAR
MAVHDDPVVGYRFRPDIEQLLVHYLRPKLEGQAFPTGPVYTCDLYGHQEPWQIWEAFKESLEKDQNRKDLYFITPHKKKTLKGSRISRTIGSGTWKGEDASKKVLAASRRVIGRRKRFHYENKGSVQNGRWLMHEYELDASLLQNKHQAKKYVLCILRKNDKTEKDQKQEEQENQEEDMMSCDYGDQQDGGLHEPQFVEQETTQDNFRQHLLDFEVYHKIAEQAMKKNDHKDSQKMTLEELERQLMSDD